MQRLLCLLLRLLRLRRGGIGSISVCGRRLVVWIMDHMAIWRARERRRRLASVHGVASQFGSSSNQANSQECDGTEECRLQSQKIQSTNKNCGRRSAVTVQKTRPEDGECRRATAHKMRERESNPPMHGR